MKNANFQRMQALDRLHAEQSSGAKAEFIEAFQAAGGKYINMADAPESLPPAARRLAEALRRRASQ